MINLRINDKYKYILVGLSITIAACLIAFTLSPLEIARRIELMTLDLRFRWQSDVKPGSDIVLMAVSEEILQDEKFYKSKGKLSRRYYADVASKLLENNAKIVVFNLIFEQKLDHIGDAQLVDVTKQYPQKIVHAMGVNSLTVDGKENLYQAADLSLPWAELMEASSSIGHIMTIPDIDGHIRKVPLIIEHKNRYYPSLSLISARKRLEISDEQIRIELGRRITLEDSAHDRVIRIPIDKKARIIVKYPKSITAFARYSLKDIYDYESKKEQGIPVSPIFDNLKGKIVFIYSSTTDHVLTPVSNKFPGVGIHASILQSILSGKFIRDIGVFPGVILMFIIAGFVTAAQLFWAPLKAFIAASVILLVFLVVAWCVFVFAGIAFNVTQIVLVIFLCCATTGYYRWRQVDMDLLKARQREMALEGITGLALEIVDISHRMKRMPIPLDARLMLHTNILQFLHQHFAMDLPATKDAEPLSTVIREALKRAYKDRFEEYADNLQEIMNLIQDMPEGQEVSIKEEGKSIYIGEINFYLLNSNPIDVRKPYMLQAVLKCIIDNAFKSLRKLREKNLDAKAELRITSHVSGNYYVITVCDSGGPFGQETMEHLEMSLEDLITWMKDELENIEKSSEDDLDEEVEELFLNLPVGLGLLLSRLILKELYSGDLEINNQPKSVTVKCKKA